MALTLGVFDLMWSLDLHVPWLTPLLGAFVALVVPSFVIAAALPSRIGAGAERAAVGATTALLALLLSILAANTVLPAFSVMRPLDPTPSIVLVNVFVVALGALFYRRHPRSYPWLGLGDRSYLAMHAAALIPLTVIGAVRLNNGAGNQVTLAMLLYATVTLTRLVKRSARLSDNVLAVSVYFLALALLLMTSLRGWLPTGHDIQYETAVFRLTKADGRWNMGVIRNAYNACLSITALPTVLSHATGLSDAQMFKVLFQCLFAVLPVTVYFLSRRFTGKTIALLSAVLFMSFITFFQDMPMLNRQEIAFLFLGGAFLVDFNSNLSPRWRRIAFVALSAGVIVSHYSTTYVSVGALMVAWALRATVVRIRRYTKDHSGRTEAFVGHTGLASLAPTNIFMPAVILPILVMAGIWAGPLTHTSSGIVTTAKTAINTMLGRSDEAGRSSDTAYSIFGHSTVTPEERLADYREIAVDRRGDNDADYFPLDIVETYPTAPRAEPDAAITAAGRALERIGISPSTLNARARTTFTLMLQVFLLAGLGFTLLAPKRSARRADDMFFLAAANVAMVFVQVVLPGLSVDYGLLRAFQQALMVAAVFIVTGGIALAPKRFTRAATGAVAMLTIAFFVSTTGIGTAIFGGYGNQIHLANAGLYHDVYYPKDQDVWTIGWLNGLGPGVPGPYVASDIDLQTSQPFFPFAAGVREYNNRNDVFPILVRRTSYVFMNTTDVERGAVVISDAGDLINYAYPIAFLDDNKDLVYVNGGSRVYR
ncbi:MAG: hypothetical protein AB7L13_20835 [Acidimicrobiia bacterium]